MADSSAHLQHNIVQSASSTTEDMHNKIRLTVQSEVKIQTLSTATTTVKILGLLSAAVLVALVVAVVDVVDVVINQQQVPELKEKIHSLQEKKHELQTIVDKLTENELTQPPPATTATTISATDTTSSAQEMTHNLHTMMAKVTETELPQQPRATTATATTYSDVVDLDLKSSCAAIHTHLPDSASGVYLIYPGGHRPGRSVWCDMETDGGGWTRFQRRYDGSVAFNKPWEIYQKGFGSPLGDFWFGNDDLHRLTAAQPSELRIELRDWNGKHGYAKYSTFSVGNASTNYMLHVGNHSGNIGDSLTEQHDSQQFSTVDRDNDGSSDHNCATEYSGGGGWWYGACFRANLNGRYYTSRETNYQGVLWWDWRYHDNHYSYKEAAMLTRPRQ